MNFLYLFSILTTYGWVQREFMVKDIQLIHIVLMTTICISACVGIVARKEEKRKRRVLLERFEKERKLRVLEFERRENASIVIQRAWLIRYIKRRYIKSRQLKFEEWRKRGRVEARAVCVLPDRTTLKVTCENVWRGKTDHGTRTKIGNTGRFQVKHPEIDGEITGTRTRIVKFKDMQ